MGKKPFYFLGSWATVLEAVLKQIKFQGVYLIITSYLINPIDQILVNGIGLILTIKGPQTDFPGSAS